MWTLSLILTHLRALNLVFLLSGHGDFCLLSPPPPGSSLSKPPGPTSVYPTSHWQVQQFFIVNQIQIGVETISFGAELDSESISTNS